MSHIQFHDRPDEKKLQKLKTEFPDVDIFSTSLFIELQWTIKAIQKEYDAFLKTYGLTESKFMILMFLKHEPNHTLIPSEIAEKLGSTKVTATKVINGLVKIGWVTKIHDTCDKRSVSISLTSEGEDILTQFLPSNYRAVAAFMDILSETEQKQLKTILEKLNTSKEQFKKEMGKS